MKICIKNCTLISMDSKRDKVENNVDILIEDDKIVEIGKVDISCDKVIDGTGKVVMPGLINTHAHVPMSIFRETLDGYNLQDWLSKKIWPMEDKLTNYDTYYASYLSFVEMIKTGTTTVNDMYFLDDGIIKAMKETGVRLQIGRSLMDNNGLEAGRVRFFEFIDLINKYKNFDSKLTFNCAIHGLYTNSPSYLEECLLFVRSNDMNIHMHFCENEDEVFSIKKLYDKSPVDVLEERFKNFNLLLAHCLELSFEDIDKLKNLNVSVAHCPVSNLRLGCGVAKIDYMLKSGINVSLGSDGQGSGSNMDLFETMKYTALLQKGINKNPEALPAYEVLKMATINGAKALGLDKKIGSIEVGKFADIIIIDTNNIVLQPINDLISNIVYNIKGSDVITTIINGNILMENRKLNIFFDGIVSKCEEIIKRISK